MVYKGVYLPLFVAIAFFGVNRPGFRSKPAGLSEQIGHPNGRAPGQFEGIESLLEVIHAEQEIVHAQD
jgi:hypothetical protein